MPPPPNEHTTRLSSSSFIFGQRDESSRLEWQHLFSCCVHKMDEGHGLIFLFIKSFLHNNLWKAQSWHGAGTPLEWTGTLLRLWHSQIHWMRALCPLESTRIQVLAYSWAFSLDRSLRKKTPLGLFFSGWLPLTLYRVSVLLRFEVWVR